MPFIKQPQSLEHKSLSCVPNLVIKVCRTVAQKCSEKYLKQRISADAAFIEVDDVIANFQDVLFTSTPHYFHKEISEMTLSALSNLLHDTALNTGNGEDYLHQSQEDKRMFLLKEQIILQFSSLLCHPSVHHLFIPGDLELSLVRALCAAIPDMTCLSSLDLGPWQCYKHGLLSNASLQDGYGLMFIQNLTSLSVTDVSLDFIINMSVFCPNLTSLTLIKSEVNEEATSYISNLRKLRKLHLKETKNMSSFDYAELLRNLPELCSLGRCDSFGEVITTLYHQWSLHKRSVRIIPTWLPLEEVDCEGHISEYELSLIVKHSPNMRNLRLAYNPVPNRGNNSESDLPDLAILSKLSTLNQLGITFADFYSHSLSTAIKTTGVRLTHLELTNVDELNLSSLMMIGDHCKLVTHLTISCCHYTPKVRDRTRMEEACTPQARSRDDRPFAKLRSASFNLTSSIHIPILKYPIFFALDLEELKLDQIYQPLEDSFISSLISWNPLQSLLQFHLTNGTHLSLIAVNTLIQSCPRLRHIGKVHSWGRVELDDLVAFKREIDSRNLDLIIE